MTRREEVTYYTCLAMAVGFGIYDAYCQAHGVEWDASWWLLGYLMYPLGKKGYEWMRLTLPEKVRELPDLVRKITKRD